MSNLEILSQEEIKEFESPPVFSFQQQRAFFDIPHWLKIKLRHLGSASNQVGFLLQLGYFRACGRFFKLGAFRQSDIRHACRSLKLKLDQIDLQNYSYTTMTRHSHIILTELGFHPFGGKDKSLVVGEVKYLVTKQFSPSSIFRSLCDFIRRHGIEIPTYHTLATLITQTIRTSEKILLETIQTQLSSQQKNALDSLFDKLPTDILGRHTYKISRYKSLIELMKLSAIRSNMNTLKELKELYYLHVTLINSLNLTEELIEYYAQYVLAADVFQVKRRNQKYLLLICFIKYQYLAINDVMIQTFMSTTQQTLRQVDNRKNELSLAWQEANLISQEQILLAVLAEAPLIKMLQDILFSLDKTRDEKYKIMIEIIKDPQHDEFLKLIPSVEKLYHESTKKLDKKLLYDAMIEKSRAFQNRVAEMLRHVEFAATKSDDKIMNALKFYQQKRGDLTTNAPMDFLNKEEKERVKEGKNGFNESLYKVLLAKYIHKSLKSGKINVHVSHQFKAFEEYMISEEDLSINEKSLVQRAGINHLTNWENIQKILEDKLTFQFNETFEAINKGTNVFVKKRKDNTLQFITPKKKTQVSSIELYPAELYVPIFEVLHTVNEHTEFTKKLTHKMEDTRREIMPDVINFASIISWGCNLGIGLMAKKCRKSKNITLATLEKTSNWHLSSKNLLDANDRIIHIMDTMPINTVFKEEENLLRSVSDGQKYTMAFNSIHANYSSKYFGKEMGVIIYSFMAEHYPVVYTTTFSAGEFEAWFILDGLLHYQPVLRPQTKKKEKIEATIPKDTDENNQENDDVNNRLHSTDQHGINYINSAICYLLGIEFQPRFKQIHKVKLYGIAGMSITQQLDYQINAGNNINTKIIAEQWNNILRLVATLKLKQTTPSTLLKRLTSYSNKHPLNVALQELGKLVQTIFVLKYMHLEDLRRIINHQLTQVESMHQLSDELNLGHDGLIQFATKEELLIMARSKQLLINSIVCYNYLYQTKKLIEANPEERKKIQKALSQSAAFAYKHINFQGEYDFSDEVVQNSLKVDLDKPLDLEEMD